MDELIIEEVWRIDYREIDWRREDEPLGLFLQLSAASLGVRLDIADSGQHVEVRAETLGETLAEFRQNADKSISRAANGTALAGLAGRAIRSIHFAYINYAEKPGPNYTFNDAALIGLQIEFTDRSVLTFDISGDEGKIDFEKPLTPPSLIFGDETWKEQPGLLDALRTASKGNKEL